MDRQQIVDKFIRIGLITVTAVYLLILVGGIVRASGSGMGCPDWPTCFGRLVPPTSESQLPADYHQRYIGYGDTTFNVLKTWTEYLNRLLGVSIGILILTTLIRSIPFRKFAPSVFYLSLTTFLMVGFQGWLGSRVVASELKPILISAHMIVAFVIVSLLILSVCLAARPWLSRQNFGSLSPRWRQTLKIAVFMTLIQITMGTQIREAVDGITNAHLISERSVWRDHFPIIFYVHRSFSSIILFTNLWLVWKLRKSTVAGNPMRIPAYGLAGLILVAISSGVSLDRLGFPAVVQPLHLLMANLIFGTQFYLLMASRFAGVADKKNAQEQLDGAGRFRVPS